VGPLDPFSDGPRAVTWRSLEQSALPGLVPDRRAHRVVEIGELFENAAEHPSERLGKAVSGLCVDFVGKFLGRSPNRRFDGLHRVDEHREGVSVAQHGPSSPQCRNTAPRTEAGGGSVHCSPCLAAAAGRIAGWSTPCSYGAARATGRVARPRNHPTSCVWLPERRRHHATEP